MELRSTQLEKERNWTRQVRGLLQVPLGADGELPRLSALSPYRLGVSPSRYGSEERRDDDPYVSRVIDDTLDRVLQSKRFVLVVGDSKAGKSRTAYKAATCLQVAGRSHDPRVLVPKSTDVLGQLLDLDPPLDLRPEPALLWLDDLSENELEALTLALLDRLTGPMLVLGTLTALRHDRVTKTGSDISRNARLALERAEVIRLEADLTDQERVEAERKYPKERFKAGIGEQLVAVDQLTSRYDNARQGAHPHGWAVVQAAIDWTRMDVGRPISQHELVALCPLYLDHLRAHARHDNQGHEEALDWACQPVVSRIALLEERRGELVEPSYVPFDYFVAAADGQGGRSPQPILDLAWDKVLALVSPLEAVRAGISASLRRLPLRAQTIFTVIAAGTSDEAPIAALLLGMLLAEQGDVKGAKAAYQQAIASGHLEAAPSAANNLGVLLAEQGDVEGAKAAYQQAIASSHSDVVGMAVAGLGELLKEQGDVEGAKAVYRQAIASGHAEAAVNLGVLLAEQGDVEGAKAAYQQAIASGHPDQVPKAANNLGVLLAEQGDVEGAKAAYQQAIASGHPDQVPKAANNLGELLKEQGDVKGATAAFRQASTSGHPDVAPTAAVNLGVLLAEQGDVKGAKAAYQQAIASGHLEAAPSAANNLGVLLAEQGDVEGAKAAYQQAIASGHPEAASRRPSTWGCCSRSRATWREPKPPTSRPSRVATPTQPP